MVMMSYRHWAHPNVNAPTRIVEEISDDAFLIPEEHFARMEAWCGSHAKGKFEFVVYHGVVKRETKQDTTSNINSPITKSDMDLDPKRMRFSGGYTHWWTKNAIGILFELDSDA